MLWRPCANTSPPAPMTDSDHELEKALASLSGKLDPDAQAKLIDQSIQSLGKA